MKMFVKKWAMLGLVATMGASAMAQSQDEGRGRTYLGVKGGLYLPTDSEIRDIFGSSIVVFGLSFDDLTRQADKWRLTADFDFIGGEKDGNKFFAAPFTASIGKVFGNREDNTRPYVRFGAGGAYYDYSITRPGSGERFSTKRFGASADVEAGLIIGERFRVSAKYQWLSKADDFDFSGFQIVATYQLFKF